MMDGVPDLADLPWPRTTERLSLRPLVEDDVDAICGYRRREDVQRWLGGRRDTREALVELFLAPDKPRATLVIERDGVVIGDLMLLVQDGWSQRDVADRAAGTAAELGWVLDPAYAGQGLATEAVRELLAVALDPAPSGLALRRVTAGCFADNTASWRLMERVGLRREQHAVGDSLHRDLGWVDGYYYALLAEEWSAMSERD